MSELALPQDTIILGESEYTAAIDTVITAAQETLLIFDQDCSTGDFASIKRFELIEAFLNKNPLAKLTLILHRTDIFSSRFPRLFNLLDSFSHKMTVYQTNSRARIAKDCFILADSSAYIRRFHIDQARFRYDLNDPETTESLTSRFDELMEETTHTLTTTKLGL